MKQDKTIIPARFLWADLIHLQTLDFRSTICTQFYELKFTKFPLNNISCMSISSPPESRDEDIYIVEG